ncbi:MAG: hypothetical protein ABIO67_11040 [Mycobacteriales bacterium]
MVEQRISAEDVSAAVRVHADRVHDFVRRLGCAPGSAAEVVETSAMDLVRTAASAPGAVGDAVGWWFGRARALGTQVAGGAPDLPLGGGLLSADADQALVAEALETLPERERVALLMRDSYALPASSLAVALGTDAEAAMETVGRGRLRFLQGMGEALPKTAGHTVALSSLARLAEGGAFAARDATPRRHAQSCPICRAVWDNQEQAHQLLAGLTVVAMPEAARNALLAAVDGAARSTLPTSATLLAALEDGDEIDEEGRRSRWAIPVYLLLGFFVAIGLGLVIGLMATRSPSSVRTTGTDVRDQGVVPSVTAAPLPSETFSFSTVEPTPTGPVPSTSVFTVSPSPAPSPTTTDRAQPSPSAAPEPARDPLTLTSNPSSGPNGQQVTVSGTGWVPGGAVTLEYLDPLGRQTGSRTTQTIDARGRFTTTIAAQDPTNLPGRHSIRASDGRNSASVFYNVTG